MAESRPDFASHVEIEADETFTAAANRAVEESKRNLASDRRRVDRFDNRPPEVEAVAIEYKNTVASSLRELADRVDANDPADVLAIARELAAIVPRYGNYAQTRSGIVGIEAARERFEQLGNE